MAPTPHRGGRRAPLCLGVWLRRHRVDRPFIVGSGPPRRGRVGRFGLDRIVSSRGACWRNAHVRGPSLAGTPSPRRICTSLRPVDLGGATRASPRRDVTGERSRRCDSRSIARLHQHRLCGERSRPERSTRRGIVAESGWHLSRHGDRRTIRGGGYLLRRVAGFARTQDRRLIVLWATGWHQRTGGERITPGARPYESWHGVVCLALGDTALQNVGAERLSIGTCAPPRAARHARSALMLTPNATAAPAPTPPPQGTHSPPRP